MEKNKLVFGKLNYILMVTGLIIVMIGFLVMSLEKGEYGIGDLGLTVGPLIVLLGFAVEFVAILIKPKSNS